MSQALYVYLDESISDQIVVCAGPVFMEDKIHQAEMMIKNAKQSLGLPPETELHCKVLFHGDRRKNSDWANVGLDKIFSTLKRLCQELKTVQALSIAIALPPKIPSVPAGPQEKPPAINLDLKGIASMGFQMILGVLGHKFSPETIRPFIDRDTAKIPWGGKRLQAHRTQATSIDLGPTEEPYQINPEPQESGRKMLLEVADLYAYVTRRCNSKEGLTGGWKNRELRHLYEIIEPELLDYYLNSNPVWNAKA